MLQLSLVGSKTEVMGGMIHHVTVMGMKIRTMSALHLAGIEIIDHVLALLEATIDVVMLAPLVVAIVLPTETIVVGVRGAKAEEVQEVEAVNTVNGAPRTAIVGVIVPLVKIRHCRHQVPRISSMIARFHLITSRVSPHAAAGYT